jgi:hypothetical protein
MPLAGLILTAAVATSVGTDAHFAAVENAIFELCPKVLSGELDMKSEAAAESVGYRLAAPNPKRTNIESGEGETSIVIWGPKEPGAAHPSCIVTFAAPDMNEMFDALGLAARKHGFDGGEPTRVSPKARQLRLSNMQAKYPSFYMLEVGGGADFVKYDKLIMVLISPKES